MSNNAPLSVDCLKIFSEAKSCPRELLMLAGLFKGVNRLGIESSWIDRKDACLTNQKATGFAFVHTRCPAIACPKIPPNGSCPGNIFAHMKELNGFIPKTLLLGFQGLFHMLFEFAGFHVCCR